jgi:hypothetical protein
MLIPSGPLSLWERVRVRGFSRTLGTLTPALSLREREQRSLAQKTVRYIHVDAALVPPISDVVELWV